MRISTLVVVGVGLIGGSVALAARRRGVASRVLGVDREEALLAQARSRGLLDEIFIDPSAAVAEADLVVFCTPVDRIAAGVLSVAPWCRPGTLLTDVGSTKATIVAAVEGHLPPGVAFVGSHPLAGSEKHGSEHGSASLFEGRLVLVTPLPDTSDTVLSQISAFWQALGARVEYMTPLEHDRALALTSHLPHLIASTLAGILPPEWAYLTATGFRDTTRLAASNPSLWSAIFRANQPAVLAALDQFEAHLQRFRHALTTADADSLDALLRQGKHLRDKLN
jgi:prephenate dehydrogenase